MAMSVTAAGTSTPWPLKVGIEKLSLRVFLSHVKILAIIIT